MCQPRILGYTSADSNEDPNEGSNDVEAEANGSRTRASLSGLGREDPGRSRRQAVPLERITTMKTLAKLTAIVALFLVPLWMLAKSVGAFDPSNVLGF